MRASSILAFLIACGPVQDDAWEVADGALFVEHVPRSGLVHGLDAPMVPGMATAFRAVGAVPGETVYFVRSFEGLGSGPCPGLIGGHCMGILAPITLHGSAVADADGVAVLDWVVPPSASVGFALYSQAVSIRGVGGASSELSEAIVETVHSPDGDLVVADVDLGVGPAGCDLATLATFLNDGASPLTLESIVPSEGVELGSIPLPKTLLPGESADLLVQVDMGVAEDFRGTVTVTSDDPGGDEVFSVSVAVDDTVACPDAVDAALPARHGAIDLTLLLDTTCSMGATIDATAEAFQSIASDIQGFAGDLTFGVASFDDYNSGAMGTGDDKPFILHTTQTNDRAVAQGALDGIVLHYGADGPESANEGLFQALSGMGYDQDCDGVYDGADDVLPFIGRPDDAFGGSPVGHYAPDVSGSGELGGMGFRDGTLRFVAYATDNELRDPSDGYDSPGGCAVDATPGHVLDAAAFLDARLIGIDSGVWGLPAKTEQMEALGLGSGTMADLDGDGAVEPVILDFEDASSLNRDLVAAIAALLPPDDDWTGTLELVVMDDPDGLIVSVEPATFAGAAYGEVLSFTATVNGVTLDGPAIGASRAEIALFHDGQRLGAVDVWGALSID